MFASTTISASICFVYNLTMKLVKTTWTVLHLNKKKKKYYSVLNRAGYLIGSFQVCHQDLNLIGPKRQKNIYCYFR